MNASDADSVNPDDVPAASVSTDGAAGDTPAKPRRRRAPRKADAAPTDSADLGDSGAGVVPVAAAEATPAPRQVDAPSTVAEASDAGNTAHGDTLIEPAAASVEGAAGPADERSSRRSRHRRRGRRGGERAQDGEPSTEDEARVAGTDAGDATDGAAGLDATASAPEAPRGPPVDPAEVFAQVLSGAFDVEPEAEGAPVTEAAAPPRRVLAAELDAPKLQKVLAQSGVGSRRDLEQMIVEGRITVNGEPAHTGQRVSFGDRIQIDGKPVRYRIAPPPARVLAYHKPAGEVVTHDDPQQRPTVFRRLPRLQQGKWQSVGRLDINTEGLLLFTNSGELANQLMHPRFGVEREYAVRSLGVLAMDAKARLLEGVEIEGQRCAFKSIEDGGGEGVNHWYRVVITEGRNREVRKLFDAVGHAVSRLIRIRYGSVVLPRGLKRGVWVDLDEHDLRTLRRLAGGPRVEAEAEGVPAGKRPRDRKSVV